VNDAIVSRPASLPLGPIQGRGTGWNGMVMLIVAEAALFGYLLFSYYYHAAANPPGWVLEPEPRLTLALPDTLLLLASSIAAWWGERGVKQGQRGTALAGIGLTFVMGLVFAVVQVFEWRSKAFGLATSSYSSLYFVTTGFHVAHVIVGLLVLAALWLWVERGYFSAWRDIPVSNGIIYWHFVDAVWLFVFSTYYLTPYLGLGT